VFSLEALPELVPPADDEPPVAFELVEVLDGALRFPDVPSVPVLDELLMLFELEPLPDVSPVFVAPPCFRLHATIANAAQRMKVNFFIADFVRSYFSFLLLLVRLLP
jgi:hypothetical protein